MHWKVVTVTLIKNFLVHSSPSDQTTDCDP